MSEYLKQKAEHHLDELCNRITDRSVGNAGNIKATEYFHDTVSSFGWNVQRMEMPAIDWEDGGAIVCSQYIFQSIRESILAWIFW